MNNFAQLNQIRANQADIWLKYDKILRVNI